MYQNQYSLRRTRAMQLFDRTVENITPVRIFVTTSGQIVSQFAPNFRKPVKEGAVRHLLILQQFSVGFRTAMELTHIAYHLLGKRTHFKAVLCMLDFSQQDAGSGMSYGGRTCPCFG